MRSLVRHSNLVLAGVGCFVFMLAVRVRESYLLHVPSHHLHARDPDLADTWAGWGGSQLNDRWASTAHISSSNIKSLKLKCQIEFPSGVSAPATLHEGIAYFPTWNGSLVALDYAACHIKWQINVVDITRKFNPNFSTSQLILSNQLARTSPQIDPIERVLYFGTQTWALLVAADLDTGAVLGQTQVNQHEFALVTISPTFYNGTVYIGASSDEEDVSLLADPSYDCCSFVGNAAAFTFDREKKAFTTKWNVSMIPPDLPTHGAGKWSGAGVWGSQPAIDVERQLVYYGTGNLYSIPDAYYSCGDAQAAKHNSSCALPNVYTESVLALDLATGKPKWTRRVSPLDAWTLACGEPGNYADNPQLCPQTFPGTDADFGMAPAFVPGSKRGGGTRCGKDVVTLGQKNGNVYALAADDGALEWAAMVTPGSAGGGISWGVAVDDERVYFTGINPLSQNWTLVPSGRVTNSSGFGAVDLATGRKLWDAPAPRGQKSQVLPTVVGDLLLTGWTGPSSNATGVGGLLALNKKTGETLLRYPLDAPFYGGIAVSGNLVMLGTGYSRGLGDGSFMVFSVDS